LLLSPLPFELLDEIHIPYTKHGRAEDARGGRPPDYP
jgi:hypothetical protein